ncbi:hypothetical protein BM1_05991 [Bipolaris maydis]|nr:hypothetical protein BM1_05991 [Bipolaris maydis]
MNDKDPPPFGSPSITATSSTDKSGPDTFSDDFFDNAAPHYDSNGPSLLSDMENQQLDNFFSSTNPFDLLDSQHIPPALDDKSTAHDYNNWEDFIAPPTVHRVTSTIPDQARLQTTFQQEPRHASSSSLHGNFLANTQDELQAAATLFNHAQPSYANGRLHSFPEQPVAASNFLTNVVPGLNHAPLPMSVQPHGLMNQRMPSLLPNHGGHALDPQFPPQWTNKAPQHTQTDFGPPLQKIDLKRSYTFGTDNSFNSPSGYSGANGRSAEHSAARHSINDVEETTQHILRAVAGIDTVRTTSAAYQDSSSAVAGASRDDDDDEQSDDSASQEEHDDRPAKRRKKSIAQPGKETPGKAARNGKARKTSLTDESKKKRAATSTQKTHRENLTEEQKRNNHILSEQKRRDLIKQGYKDLNEVVPAVRGGGLSKSQILVEAATFLEKLIEDNIAYRKVAG